VIVLAFRHLRGAILTPEQFSSGSSGQSNLELSGMGSTVKVTGDAVA